MDAQIQQKAYEIYLDRLEKGIPGTAESDWNLAKKLLSLKQQVHNELKYDRDFPYGYDRGKSGYRIQF